jgi:hypothetical protein
MPANFPTSPTIGDRHTIADKTWEWTGSVWDLVVSTNTLQFSGEDSAVITVNLTANEELRIVGDGQSISTTGNAGDSATSTLQISLNKTIDVNEIISSDSTLVTIVDGLATPLLTSLDSSAVQVNDGINVRGSLTLENGVSVDAILDENNLASDSDTALATQQSIKAYVDSQVTSGVSGGTMTFVGDDSSGSTLNIGNTLSIVGGNSVSSSVTNDTVTLELDKDINVNTISSGDSTSVTVNDGLIVTGNLSFDGGVSVSTILDEDTLSSDSDTALATQQSIKAYVDSQITATNTLKIGDDASSEISLDLDTTLNVQGGNSITSSVTGDTLTVALNDSITVDDITAKDSTAININSPIQVSGNINTDTSLTVAGYTVNQILDEDTLSSNSDTALATQQSIKAYVDSQISGSNTITLGDDASSVISLDLDGILNVKGGNSITSVVTGDTLTFKLDDNITVDQIGAKDSSSIQFTSPINVDTIQSSNSTAIQINDGLNVAGTLSANTIDTNIISSGDSTAVVINDDLIPGADDTYSLGSPLRQWSTLFVTGNTIYLGDLILQSVGSNQNARLKIKNKKTGRTVQDIDPDADYDAEGSSGTTDITNMLTVVGDDSSGSTLNSHDTIKFQGDTNVSITVDDDSSVGTTIVNTRLNDTISLAGDLTVSGNLTVSGTTTYVETTNTKISDPLLLLNNGNSGGADLDAGIMIERGSAGNNAVFYWNEGDDVFKAVTTTSGEDATGITDTQLANVRVAEPTDNSDAATKNYVDTATASIVTTIGISDSSSTSSTLTLGTNDLEFRAGNSITPTVSGTGVTFALNKSIDVDTISSTDSTAVTINDGLIVTGNMSFDGGVAVQTILDEDSMASDSDTALVTQQSIKAYVDARVGGVSQKGNQIELGAPADSSTFPVGAISTLTETAKVTDAIDDLNEALENVRNNTFVKSVDFVADQTSGGAGLVVTLTITAVGNANRYDITWGDGDTTIGTTDSTPTHTYSSNAGSPFDVTVRAYNSSGEGTGSEATETKADYITIYTANPSVSFSFYAASSGGSAISRCDLGSTIYLENTTTNTTGVTATFSIDWGDGVTEQITANGNDGGVDGGRLAHTYDRPDAGDSSTTLVGDGDLRFAPRLTLLSHQSADPAQIPASSSTSYLYVYAEHEPLISVDGSTIRGVNEESTSGFPVTFNNDTISRPGAYANFNTDSGSNTYTWNFGEGGGNITVNIGSGSAGDTGVDRSNTFNLSTAEQNAGTTQTYTTTLAINNGNSNSPFQTNLNIIVEPDVRANIAGTADTVSTGSSDNQYTLYDVTDLDGNNRASATFTNTSQHNDDNEYDFFNDSSDVLSVTEASAGAGSTSATLTKNFSGTSAGSFTTDFKVTGTPDTIFQTDAETITWTMKSTPSAPANLSTKSITLADASQGTNPHLCAGFDDNTGAASTLSAGDSLEQTTARRYTTTTTIDTSTASNFYNGASGTLAAEINASDDGTKAFTSTENETGTFTSLVVSSNVDYDTVDGTYPQRLYLVASAKITKALADYTVGVNAQRLTHTATGNTNYVHVVKDDITSTPTTTMGTITEGTAGTQKYISGLPYYNTGSPTLTVTGTTVANFTGQAYQDAADPHEIDPGTNQESTSGNVISAQSYTYANIDGASSMLTGGIPNADTGVSSAYTLGSITVPLTSSSVESVQRIKSRSKNANGTGSYNESTTNIQVYTATTTGLDKEDGGITVSDSLGAGFDDDAVRIYSPNAFYSTDSSTVIGDTPNYNSATNFYTSHAFAGSSADVVEGTDEAICRWGTVSHNLTDYSTGYLPVGPNLSTQPRDSSTAQYYTIAFRRTTMANFTLTLTGTVSGVFIAAPGTAIDSASTLNGWLDASTTYGGSGVPGADTGNGGNGSNGCAFTSGDRIIDGTSYSGDSFTLTLGSENATNATGNVVLVRFKLNAGDSISSVSIA